MDDPRPVTGRVDVVTMAWAEGVFHFVVSVVHRQPLALHGGGDSEAHLRPQVASVKTRKGDGANDASVDVDAPLIEGVLPRQPDDLVDELAGMVDVGAGLDAHERRHLGVAEQSKYVVDVVMGQPPQLQPVGNEGGEFLHVRTASFSLVTVGALVWVISDQVLLARSNAHRSLYCV